MSARFGRNQRRRAREAIAAQARDIRDLHDALNMERGLLSYLRGKIDRLQEEIAEAKLIAGNMSVLFPAETVTVDGKPGHNYTVPVIQPQPMLADYLADLNGACNLVMHTQDLPVMLANVDKDALSCAVHVVLEFRGREVGYAISEKAMLCRTGEAMQREMRRVLPRMAADLLKGVRR